MTTPNILREFCSRCGGPNGRKHSWCKTCFSFYARGTRPDFGPPRACRNGHPYVEGSFYIRERDACRKCKVCQRNRWHAKEKGRRQLKRAEASRQRQAAVVTALAAHVQKHAEHWTAAESWSEAVEGLDPAYKAG